jgi:hypothetical protein
MLNKLDLEIELEYARLMLAILEDDHELNDRGMQYYRDRITELEKEMKDLEVPQDKYPQDKYPQDEYAE